MKLDIPMFFGLPNPNLKLVSQNSTKRLRRSGDSQNFPKTQNSQNFVKLSIPMFFGLPNPILKLVFQDSRKGAPRGGGGILKIFYK